MNKGTTFVTMTLIALLLSACATEVVDGEFFGNIDGSVMHSETEKGIQGVSVETTPATEVMLTDGKGNFSLKNVPTGNYQIRLTKADYKSKVVSIMVRQDRTASAMIMLEPEEEETSASNLLEADVTSWFQTGPADSSDVEIEYKITNTSANESVDQFEVYFDIHTNQETFYYEVSNEKLEPNEKNFGKFQKFVRDSRVDSVTVSGIWMSEPE